MKTVFGLGVLLAVSPASALAASPLGPCQFDLKVAPGAGAGFGASADFSTQLQQIETSLKLVFQADPSLAPADPLAATVDTFTSHESLGLNAAWTVSPRARLNVSAADTLDQTRNLLSLATDAGRQVSTDARSAGFGLTLTPLKGVDLSLTGQTERRSVFDVAVAATVAQAQNQFVTTAQTAGAGVKWTVVKGVSLDASGKVEATNVAWRAAAQAPDAGLDYAYFEPSLTAAVATPGQGKFSLTFEHAVSPIDPGLFASFAAVADRSDAARFGPNREWRYRLGFDQTLAGDVKLSAALVQARLESSTELGPVGTGVQAPMSVAGGQRSEVDVSLSTPLGALGLPSFSLKGAGAWRSSQVRDPFTGDLRRMSGETPQLVTLELVQALPAARARWGVQGRLGGDQTLYQMSQVTNLSVADSLGGFIEYDPGAFALRLQVDGLYGGDRSYTDTYYAGPRADDYVDHVVRHTDGGQAVRLTLSKAL